MGIRARLAALLLILVPLAIPAPGMAAEEVPSRVPAEVQALAEAQAQVSSLAGTFRWLTGTVDGSGEVKERKGEFHVVRQAGKPPKYNVKLTDLQGDDVHRWCSDGVGRWAIEQLMQGEKPDVRPIKPGAQDIDLDRVVACVLLDLPVLTRDFAITVDKRDGASRLVFKPLSEDLRQELAQVVVTLDGDDPQEVLMDDAKGTRIRLVIKELVKNREWPDLLFNPVPKP